MSDIQQPWDVSRGTQPWDVSRGTQPWDNYPNEQVDAIWNFLENVLKENTFPNKEELRKEVYRIMSSSKICIRCRYRSVTEYIACPGCGIYWYCSKNCLEKDKNIHQHECGNVNLPHEKIRLCAKIAITNIKDGKQYHF